MRAERKTKTGLQILLLILIICASALAGVFSARAINKQRDTAAEPEPTAEPTEIPVIEVSAEPEETFPYAELQEVWKENKAKNPDYQGQFFFESGLIDEPFVQGATNDTYIRTNWETMEYDEFGSIFMDERNTLDDQNIILYGHYAYTFMDPTRSRMFTPLERLREKEVWEDNRYVDLVLEHEVRRYEIVAVFYCELVEYGGLWYGADEDLGYYWTEYSPEYFERYKAAIQRDQFYDTGVDYGQEDNFLTLQTCVENHEELREVVLCREIERTTE